MAVKGGNALTLADWASRRDPNDKTARIVEMLEQTNEVLDDMLWLEGNLPQGHRTTIRTALPSVGYRRFNQGATISKSGTRQQDFATANLEAWSQVDVDLVNIQNDQAAFRLSESDAFLEAMSQRMAGDTFYGNADTDPDGFTGLVPWYDAVANEWVIDAGGTGSDNTSVWLVGWGEHTIHGIYPKGSAAGLQHEDLGEQTVLDDNNRPYRALQDKYTWKCGLAVRDRRYAVRIANVDVSNLKTESNAVDLIKVMIRATRKIPSLKKCKPAFYVNRTIATGLDLQALAKSNLALAMREFAGEEVTTFRRIPIRLVDQLSDAEARVV